MHVALIWFRRNLRLADNSAVRSAVESAEQTVPVFIHREIQPDHGPGTASLAWLDRSLGALEGELRARGSRLVIRAGAPAGELVRLAEECSASSVHCQRDWSPQGMAEETAARATLGAAGISLEVAEGQLLVPPDSIATGNGDPYRVFTPFWRAWRSRLPTPAPDPAPALMPYPKAAPASAGPLSPGTGAPDVPRWWDVGEPSAQRRLETFVSERIDRYDNDRDRPGVPGTSELSPRLAWGELSPAQVVHSALSAGEAAEPFIRQLAWREFAYHVLHHHPRTVDEPLNERFSGFPWSPEEALLDAWRAGATGYPLVDAGMRQLAATGWMHNRVRLVCGSFLTKHLLQPWQLGEAHFRERLVDYDIAANVFNWQWIAGCGADAAPYFRIFNPSLQGERFDADGAYVRRWVPELAGLESKWVHALWKAPHTVLESAGVSLGSSYPAPIVDHVEARARALAAYAAISGPNNRT